jgi:TRAP-type C4-dicarboxylate transport system permease small subunit
LSTTPLGALRRALRAPDEAVAILALLLTVGAVTWGVITRYVTSQPAVWASEVAAIGFAWLTFFGASACFRHNAHPSIDMLVGRLPPATQRATRFGVDLLVAVFLAYFAWMGVEFSIAAWDNPTAVLRLPMTVVYGPITLATMLMLLRHATNMWRGRRAPERAMA